MFKYIYFIFISFFKCFKKILIVKVFFCLFFSNFSPFKKNCYNFVSFYLFINNTIDGWCEETEDPTSVCLSATTTRTWRWNILGQVQLISRPHFCHLGVAESASQRLLTSRNGQVQTNTLTNK